MKEENAYDLLHRGRKFLKEGNSAQAAVVLKRAGKIEPEKGSILEALGQAYYNYKQYYLAKDEFEKAVEIDPTNHYAHFGLGLCLNHLGQKVFALKHLKIALAMEPDSEDYQKALKKVKGSDE